MTNKNLNKGSQIAIILGGALVLFGLIQLLKIVLGPAWVIFERVWNWIGIIAWPLFIIAMGAAIVFFATQGGLSGAKGKKLYRSQNNRWVSGVLGGLSEYLGVDATLLRLAYVVFCLASLFPAIIAYFILAVVVPENPYISADPR